MSRVLMVLAMSLAAASAASAQAARNPAPRPAASALTPDEQYLMRFAEWAAPYKALQAELMDLLGDVNAGAEKAFAYFDSGDRAGGAAWARGWRAEREARLRAVKLGLAALDPEPPVIDPGLRDNDLRRQVTEGMGRAMPRLIRAVCDQLEAPFAEAMELIERTAGGDAVAEEKLTVAVLDIGIIGYNARADMWRAFHAEVPTVLVGLRSEMRLNLAVEEIGVVSFRLMRGLVVGEPLDRAAAAHLVRLAADEVEAAGRVMEREDAKPAPTSLSAEMQRRERESRALDPELYAALREVVRRIRTLADVIEAGAALDEEGFGQAYDAMVDAVRTYVAIHHRQRQTLTG